jgi:O-antigen/teichoic acid export membrane protein
MIMPPRDLFDRVRTAAARPVVADSFRLQLGQAASLGVQAVTSLVLLRSLGPDLVGLYAISAALAAAVALLDLSGANRVAVIDVARARGAAELERIGTSLGTFLRVSLRVRVPIVVAFFAFAPDIAGTLYGNRDAGMWARWLGLPLATDLPFDLLVVTLQGRGEIRALVRVETTRAIATSTCLIAALLAGWGLLGVALVHVATSIAAALWAWRRYGVLAARDPALPGWADLVRMPRASGARSRAAAGVSMAIEKNLGNLGGQLPLLLVGALRPEAAGYFSAALRTMSLPYPLVSAFARHLEVLLPHRAGQGADAVRRTFARATLTAGAAWTVVTIGMILLGPIILVQLAGADYAPAVPVLYPLVLQSLATGAGVGIGAALRAVDRPAYGVALQAISIIATAPFGYLLIVHSGALGAAWFHALRYALLTVAGIACVLWLVRPRASYERGPVT